jgi:hypothetical protein
VHDPERMPTYNDHKPPAASAETPRIMAFLGAAFRDYIAARVLLINALSLQGAVQASTAIEKYLKTFLAFKGQASHGHLKHAHLNALKNIAPGLYARLNEEFLLLCKRVYNVRYPDSLPVGFNIVVATREFLAELDHTVLTLHDCFYVWQDGREADTEIDVYLKNKDPRLLLGNHALFNLDKSAFVAEKPQHVYELRVNSEPAGLREINYVAQPTASDGHFLREGLRPADSNSFSLALKLLQDEEAAKWEGGWHILRSPDSHGEGN